MDACTNPLNLSISFTFEFNSSHHLDRSSPARLDYIDHLALLHHQSLIHHCSCSRCSCSMAPAILTLLLLTLPSLLPSSCHAITGAGGRRRLPPTLPMLRRYSAGPGGGGSAVPPPPPQVQYETRRFTQRLDHFNALPASYATFQQRYLVNGTFWGGRAAPVFVYAGNEGEIELFANNTGLMWETAPRFRAMLVFVEHRYYGDSMPAAAYSNSTTTGYLTTTQALADFAELILSLKANLSAHAAPVVVFGGSYGGMLAAWMRMKYPHIVMGAVASSAPILGFYGLSDPYSFYDVISNDFKSESQHCYDVLRSSWSELDKALATDAGRAQLTHTFNMCKGNVDAIPGLLENALVYVAMTDYPTPSSFLTSLPAYPVRQICRAIDQPTSGNETLARIKEAMAIYYNHTGGLACFGGAGDEDPYGMLAGWNWQACTEMVLTMSYGVSGSSIFPPEPFNFTDVLAGCRAYTGLPPRPYWIEAHFGGFDIVNVLKRSASNIIFFNGLRDPWSAGGVLKSISKSIIALVEPEGGHHVDLRFSTKEDPEWLKKVRRKEMRIIADWLRQYYSEEAIA
ncbi:lysosomal Pro-X carboxypeptidase-like [Oryza brachyantha]|uniref:lysosomal Pro-X carboxypeptidase-like n=1 Tax=Oryza brachyantha TaxID=4533 RepID=UPI001AD9D73C|nr:lysosomal Pro-X carboxypeptidase-like [Oryza brachyantha]